MNSRIGEPASPITFLRGILNFGYACMHACTRACKTRSPQRETFACHKIISWLFLLGVMQDGKKSKARDKRGHLATSFNVRSIQVVVEETNNNIKIMLFDFYSPIYLGTWEVKTQATQHRNEYAASRNLAIIPSRGTERAKGTERESKQTSESIMGGGERKATP